MRPSFVSLYVFKIFFFSLILTIVHTVQSLCVIRTFRGGKRDGPRQKRPKRAHAARPLSSDRSSPFGVARSPRPKGLRRREFIRENTSNKVRRADVRTANLAPRRDPHGRTINSTSVPVARVGFSSRSRDSPVSRFKYRRDLNMNLVKG